MTTRGEQSTLLLWWSLTMEWLNSLVNWLLGWTWTSDVASTKFSGCYYRKCGVGDISTAIMAVKFIFAPFLPSVPFPHCAFPAAISLQPVSINRCTRDARREGAKWCIGSQSEARMRTLSMSGGGVALPQTWFADIIMEMLSIQSKLAAGGTGAIT